MIASDNLVASHLARAGARVRVERFCSATLTAEQAAAAAGCELAQIVKSLVFMVDGAPTMTLVAGDRRADRGKVAAARGAAKASLADPDAARRATGYEVGVVPPAGHPSALPTLVDSTLARFDLVWVASGWPDELIEIAFEDLVSATGGTVADISR